MDHLFGVGVTITKSNREIFQEFDIARAPHWTALGFHQKLLFSPAKQLVKWLAIQGMSWLEGWIADGRVTIPWTDQLTIITSKYAISHRCAQRFWNWAFVFNRQIADAFGCIELVGRWERICWTNIKACGAGSTTGFFVLD